MADIPTTRVSLLARLRDRGDDDAWKDFVSQYAPVVYRFARGKGLQDADAADLTQDVLSSVSTAVGSFDPARGPFRSWLYTLAHRRLWDLRERQQRQAPGSGDTAAMRALEQAPAPDEEAHWQQEWEKQLFRIAAERIRSTFADTTWQAFWRTAVDGASGQATARALGLSVAAVYLAKSRVMVKLKAEIARLQAE